MTLSALCISPDCHVPPPAAPFVLGHLLPCGKVAAGDNMRSLNDCKYVQAICQSEHSAHSPFFNLSGIQGKNITAKRLI